MAYITLNKAHTHHQTTINGQPTNQYSRYETGIITGSMRNLPAILADDTGSDGYGFDSAVGSDDDSWHVLNAFDKGLYVDTIAVGGAMDSDHAVVVAQTQLHSLGASSVALIGTGLTQFDSLNQSQAGTFSIDALNKLMDNPSQDKNYLPVITGFELAYETDRVTFDSVKWANNSNELLSHEGRDSTLMLDMIRADTRGDLVNEFELADVLNILGAEPEQSFDALMDTKNRLDLLKNRLFKALARAGNDKISVTNVVETKPFKRQGVTNIAFVFDLSDGQKLSIWFHNPDSTPSKLMPSDIMISWKWMLNKRDVTAALSPKQGDNVQLPVLASRIMRVATKNSPRFKRTQARQLKLEQDLLDAQALIDTKTATIEWLDKDIESLNTQIDAAMKAPKVEVVGPTDGNSLNDNNVGEDMDADIKPASQDSTTQGNTDVIAPITITGKEIDVSEDVDFKTAKNNAMAYFDENLRDKVIFCPAVDSDVLLRRRGGKHIAKSNNTFRDKLQLVAAIPEMIKQGKYESYKATNKEKGSNIEGYYVLSVGVMIGDSLKPARVVLEKSNEGKALYDIGINKKEALVALGDTKSNKSFDGFTDPSQYQDFLSESYQAEDSDVKQFDKISTNDIVLNIFFDDDADLTEDMPNSEVVLNDTDDRLSDVSLKDQTDTNSDYDDIDSSEYPKMFLERNRDRANILGIGDSDILVGMPDDYENNSEFNDLYHIEEGLFANQTLNFADTVCKVVDAATSIDANSAVGDFSSTAYQDSMFDALDHNSKPTYGITVQLSKGGVYVRADIDGFGTCKLLKGDSGSEVVATIEHVFTDNTGEYQAALAEALNVQVDDDMDMTPEKDEVTVDTNNSIIKGRINESTTIKGTKISSDFVLVESKNLITSHDSLGVANPDFPQQLQPRDRSNKKSVDSIKYNSENLDPSKLGDTHFAGNGAPIIGSDLLVESGNGRAIAIKMAYDNGDADEYKEWLSKNAETFGMTPEQVNSYKQPVLVRMRTTQVDRAEFAVEANQDANTTEPVDGVEDPVEPTNNSDLTTKVDGIVDDINSSDFDAESFDVDALSAIADEAEGNSKLTAKLEAASEVYQNKLIAIAMQAMSDMVGN